MASFSVDQSKCCGVNEMSNISVFETPSEVMDATVAKLAYITAHFTQVRSFLFFTGVVAPRAAKFSARHHPDVDTPYGEALAAYIAEQGLGTITESPASKNWSGNLLRMWIWAPDWTALKERWEALGKPVDIPIPVIPAPSYTAIVP